MSKFLLLKYLLISKNPKLWIKSFKIDFCGVHLGISGWVGISKYVRVFVFSVFRDIKKKTSTLA